MAKFRQKFNIKKSYFLKYLEWAIYNYLIPLKLTKKFEILLSRILNLVKHYQKLTLKQYSA